MLFKIPRILQYPNNCLKSLKYCFKDPATGRCKALEGRPSLIFAHKTDMRKLDLDREVVTNQSDKS